MNASLENCKCVCTVMHASVCLEENVCVCALLSVCTCLCTIERLYPQLVVPGQCVGAEVSH